MTAGSLLALVIWMAASAAFAFYVANFASSTHRQIEFHPSHLPGEAGADEDCLLLVHVRRVAGQLRYRICADCAEAVITGVPPRGAVPRERLGYALLCRTCDAGIRG